MISSTSQNVSDKSDMMSSLMNKTSLMSQGGTPGSKVDSDPGGETYKIISKLDFILFWHDPFYPLAFLCHFICGMAWIVSGNNVDAPNVKMAAPQEVL